MIKLICVDIDHKNTKDCNFIETGDLFVKPQHVTAIQDDYFNADNRETLPTSLVYVVGGRGAMRVRGKAIYVKSMLGM
jgi:hypothetical protein